ncbi:MAG: S24/S26 family peptidase, partial [Myxococcota bacterium]
PMDDISQTHPHLGALRVSGDSMLPVLRRGDVVLFRRHPEVVRPGDIVVFRDCIHRAVWARHSVWEIGDANAQWPKRRSWADVEGVAVALLRDSQWIDLPHRSRRALAYRVLRAAMRSEWSRIRRRFFLNLD